MTVRVGAPIPGGELVHRARRGPPPGLNVRRGGRRRDKKKKSNVRTMVDDEALPANVLSGSDGWFSTKCLGLAYAPGA